ncbi:MAG: cytochrome c oxidase subunit II [Gemmatimonadaceae bacterium]
MTRIFRPRQLVTAFALAALPLILAACSGNYPNSTFQHTTEFNRDLTSIWNTMMGWAFVVFVIVEVLLIVVMIRYRRRPDSPEPQHVHGNTIMEISWTVTPAVVLAFIAVPTVKAIWKYEAPAPAGALQIEVTGHQWWWEFKYPELGITTANEIYLPVGRSVNFALRTADVIHSFWIPGLGGKRDAIANRTNHLWFTPDSAGVNGWIGSCNEYCGSSHANMRFRVFTVNPADFDSWANHMKSAAAYPPPAPPAPDTTVKGKAAATAAAATPVAAPAPVVEGYVFPKDKIPSHIIPTTPIPAGLSFSEGLSGDAARGLAIYSRSACIGCHKIDGNRMSVGVIGPNLTHVASRATIAGGVFPNDARHLSLWIKNARKMKPGVTMNTLGKGEYDPIMKMTVTTGGLTDQEIADIVAYLQALK